MTQKKLIEFKNVSYQYQPSAVVALKDVSLDIFDRDFVGVIGPNGGGKSTLLQLMLGLISPLSGVVKVLGENPKITCTSLGHVPQFSGFRKNVPMKVEEMVVMGCITKSHRFFGYQRVDKDAALDSMSRLGISGLVGRQISSLSGGELQRALIARSIVSNPKAILLDEPTASIDPAGEEGIYSLLAELNKTMAVIMVSHDISYVSKQVKRIVCVNQTIVSHSPKEFDGSKAKEVYGYDVNEIHHDH